MKWWIAALCILGMVSCKLGDKGRIVEANDCKQELLTQLQKLADMIDSSEHGVYTFHHEQVAVPSGYDTISWHTDTGEVLTGLDSLHTQYRVYAAALNTLANTTCGKKLTTTDFLMRLGTPTSTSHTNTYFYQFNRPGRVPCYNPKNVSPYKKCSMLGFDFDESGTLEKIVDFYFWP